MLVTADDRGASVADDVFDERAVDGGLWRQRIPQRRERREDDGEGEAVAVAVPLQEKGLGGPDQIVGLLWRGRRGASAQHHPQQNERGSPYGRFTRTRCPW